MYRCSSVVNRAGRSNPDIHQDGTGRVGYADLDGLGIASQTGSLGVQKQRVYRHEEVIRPGGTLAKEAVKQRTLA